MPQEYKCEIKDKISEQRQRQVLSNYDDDMSGCRRGEVAGNAADTMFKNVSVQNAEECRKLCVTWHASGSQGWTPWHLGSGCC